METAQRKAEPADERGAKEGLSQEDGTKEGDRPSHLEDRGEGRYNDLVANVVGVLFWQHLFSSG